MGGTVVSDLEGTISTGETWRGVGRYLRERGRRRAWRAFLAVHLPLIALVRLRLLRPAAFRDRWIRDLARLEEEPDLEESYARYKEWLPFTHRVRSFFEATAADLGYELDDLAQGPGKRLF